MKKSFIILLLMFISCISAYATEESFGGIGARLYKDHINKKLIILEVFANSPAACNGLPIGGVIQQINGIKAKNISLEQATSLIRGEIGAKVDLIVKHNWKTTNYSITRAKVDIPIGKTDERYILHWKQVAPDGFEYTRYVNPDVFKVFSKPEKEVASINNYWAEREIGFKKGYDACISYPKNEQNSCLVNLVNREVAQTENDRQAALQEAMIQQQANQNYINNMNQTIMNNNLQNIDSSIRQNNFQLNNINNSIRDTNYHLNNINNSLRRW